MTKWVTIKKNGKKRAVPLGSPRKGFIKPVSQKELGDMRKVGIKHPGSLTSLGYHISEPAAAKHEALNRAVKKYGRTETLRKLAELYRLNANRTGERNQVSQDIRYVSGFDGKSAKSLTIRSKEKDILSKLNAITSSDYPENEKEKRIASVLSTYKAQPNSNDGTIVDPAYKLPGSRRYFYFNYADDDWDWGKGEWSIDKADREPIKIRRK